MAILATFIAMALYVVATVFGTIAVAIIAISFFTTFKEAKS